MLLVRRGRPDRFDGGIQRSLQPHAAAVQPHDAARVPAHVEQVVDELAHVPRLAVDHVPGPGGRFGMGVPVPPHGDGVADRREGIEQFVRAHRDENVSPVTCPVATGGVRKQ